jgi:hypothetical protein
MKLSEKSRWWPDETHEAMEGDENACLAAVERSVDRVKLTPRQGIQKEGP